MVEPSSGDGEEAEFAILTHPFPWVTAQLRHSGGPAKLGGWSSVERSEQELIIEIAER